jgi:flavin reductase (DIM6/NTAB) family NADH-FMN oxidoreductase RutF
MRGTTVNAFISVSLRPPILLVSIGSATRTHRLLKPHRRFAVNVLSAEHQAWSDRFAGLHGDNQGNFSDIPYQMTHDGIPLLVGTLATFVCRVTAVYPAGDHSLFLGAVDFADYDPDAAPLAFYSGSYHDLSCTSSRCRCSAPEGPMQLLSAG